ncbi:uncharacterized protein CC84DRAFT_1163168 [Paraphaeosphaeria sporulosa]|uniref:Cytochrome b561 domain-containing protein n=1 Tax=Paraphaeosphaeria sporulosa TaxID=1460663 RepID=A0A177CH19_9PLEO|nr:uncharacterized protein CC84DRAFT_1163168 [Paraphaeosphaeria sporulosa]OAG06864.1 hypothetical protein CC84DRAFT_1163168 [Paraphaeosphaeria sporulosa]
MSGLSAPGSGAYSSNTMYVGDGTWDSQRNTFLLPNLQGLNLATTQYNGMGNRFRNMSGYHSLILGHGILAAATFLFVVPAAIFLARFYHRNPRMALRLHIWLQIGTVLLSTALFILGFQAVGLKRSLTNPHHGIGVAIYTMILIQAIGGCVIHRREKGKERYKIPLKLMLHQWIGRLIALLGIVQVALGLTLYGSPLWLFVVYAIWGFILLCAWFILSYRNQPEMGFDETSTYITETTMSGRSRSHRGHGLGAVATAGAAGAGLAALRNRSRSRSTRRRGGRREVLSSHPSTYYTDSRVDEKYTEVGRKNHTWRDRLLGAGAATGGFFALKSLFGKKKIEPSETASSVSYSRPPIGQSEVTQTDLSRLEEGRAPASPGRDHWRRVEEREAAQEAAMGASPLRQGHRATRSGASIDSFDSRTSFGDDIVRPKESHGLRDGIAALGFAGFLKHQWSKRRNRKEDAHVAAVKEQDLEDERIARANSQRRKFTGDGLPPRRNGPPSTIFSESDISGTTPGVRPPRSTTHLTQTETIAGPSTTPAPAPMDPHGVLSDSGSEAYVSAGGHRHRRHHNGGSAALGAAAAGASTDRRDASQRRGSRDGSVNSPPVSVKVKMHNDGRHVTLRRLNEEEAAAEREARKKDRRRRDGSMSSLSNLENNERWRRTAAMEAAQAQEMAQASAPIPMPEPIIPGPPPGPPPMGTSAGHQSPLPPPPPIPGAGGSVMSSPQGTQVYGTETDVSAYDSNRRRRRAERAQAKQARLGGSRVEFS